MSWSLLIFIRIWAFGDTLLCVRCMKWTERYENDCALGVLESACSPMASQTNLSVSLCMVMLLLVLMTRSV